MVTWSVVGRLNDRRHRRLTAVADVNVVVIATGSGALIGPLRHDVTRGQVKAARGLPRTQLHYAATDICLARVSAFVGRLGPEYGSLYVESGPMGRSGTFDTDRSFPTLRSTTSSHPACATHTHGVKIQVNINFLKTRAPSSTVQ